SCAYRVGRILQIEVPNSQTAAGLSGGREIKKDQLPVGRGPDDARAVLAIDREGLGSPGVEGENVVVGIGRITEIGAAGEIQVGLLIVSCLQGLVDGLGIVGDAVAHGAKVPNVQCSLGWMPPEGGQLDQ